MERKVRKRFITHCIPSHYCKKFSLVFTAISCMQVQSLSIVSLNSAIRYTDSVHNLRTERSVKKLLMRIVLMFPHYVCSPRSGAVSFCLFSSLSD